MPLLDGLNASKIINQEGLGGLGKWNSALSAYSDKTFIAKGKRSRGVIGYLVNP